MISPIEARHWPPEPYGCASHRVFVSPADYQTLLSQVRSTEASVVGTDMLVTVDGAYIFTMR
jgi:hypothetical protein